MVGEENQTSPTRQKVNELVLREEKQRKMDRKRQNIYKRFEQLLIENWGNVCKLKPIKGAKYNLEK